MALQTDVCEQLRELDQVLASHDPTVQDAFKQAVVLSKVAESNPATKQPGPLEKMFWELQEMRRELDQLKSDTVTRERSTYWSKDTYERGRNYGNWGLDINTTPLPRMTIEDIEKLQPYSMPTSGMVMPASPTDADAFTMFDPDTGDSMTVKYK